MISLLLQLASQDSTASAVERNVDAVLTSTATRSTARACVNQVTRVSIALEVSSAMVSF